MALAAAVSFESEKSNKPGNLAAIASMVSKVMADHPDTDVIVFHEMCTSWLYDSEAPAAYFASVAEQIPGPTTLYVAGLASLHAVTIVIGLVSLVTATRVNDRVDFFARAVGRRVVYVAWNPGAALSFFHTGFVTRFIIPVVLFNLEAGAAFAGGICQDQQMLELRASSSHTPSRPCSTRAGGSISAAGSSMSA